MAPVPYAEIHSKNAKHFWPPARCQNSSYRLTLALIFIIGSLVMFMYYSTWTSYSTIPSTNDQSEQKHDKIRVVEDSNGEKDNAEPQQWAWVCADGVCERTIDTGNASQMSLQTCNALCSADILWPEPTGEYELGKSAVTIDSNFVFVTKESPSQPVTDHLNGAFALFVNSFKGLTQYKKRKKSSSIRKEKLLHNSQPKRTVTIQLYVTQDEDPRLRVDTDESYNLDVRRSNDKMKVNVTAKSFCGARHGLETLSQLIWFDDRLDSLLMIESANVIDKPSFQYRGLLLDTARNYFPVADILRTIDAMAATKLNTFHWHATDSQSFPLKLNRTLKFAELGAYSPTSVYTTDDVRHIVEHARLRGIRVVIETDAPAHVGRAWSWGPDNGLGDLAYCIEEEPWRNLCGEPPCGILNPANPHIQSILEEIYKEIIQLTGIDDVFHLGGDEVKPACWMKYMDCKDDKCTTNVWLSFMEDSFQTLKRANGGKAPDVTMLWTSRITAQPFINQLSKSFTIQNWSFDMKDMGTIFSKGFQTVISITNPWYFDCGFGAWRDNGRSHCGNYKKWKQVYDFRLDSKQGNILGGEACMWSEQVGSTDLDVRLWPRGAALGERLWTNPDSGAKDKVQARLDIHRSRLVSRGIGAAPLFPRWCSENPYLCDVET